VAGFSQGLTEARKGTNAPALPNKPHRRELRWVKVEKEYLFDAPEGKITLAELFDGRSQLFIKHFMMAPAPRISNVRVSDWRRTSRTEVSSAI
jgi:predicted dithiol-disulfide oxidoreductase (DUF899 family)